MKIKFPAKFTLVLEFSSVDRNINEENRKVAFNLFNINGLSGIIEKITVITPEHRLILPEMPTEKVIIPGTRPLRTIIRDLGRNHQEASLHLEFAGENSRLLIAYINQLITLLKKSKVLPDFISHTETTTAGRPYDTPAHRAVEIKKENLEAAARSLNANMTGLVTLSGNPVDLHFSQGALKGISRDEKLLLSSLNSRSRFVTSGGVLNYRNESAFSFEDDIEYGLRTLQIPELKKKRIFRVITDFIFGENHDEGLISLTVDYPFFEEGLIIYESAVFETPLLTVGESGVKIESDAVSPCRIKQAELKSIMIPGRSFTIKANDITLHLSFPEGLEGHRISRPSGLAVKTRQINDKTVFFINPGGSYTPSPAEHYNGIREQLCFTINAEKNPLK